MNPTCELDSNGAEFEISDSSFETNQDPIHDACLKGTADVHGL